jgi:hypothetical protein
VHQTLTRAGIALLLACSAGLPTAPVAAQTSKPAAPQSELDAFMEKVLARREVNRLTLQQYILDDLESVEVLGPGRAPLYRLKREYSWYVRDGLHVRSPVRFDGVTVGESARREYEDDWIRRERERLERKADRDRERAGGTKDAAPQDAGASVGGATPLAPPRFVSEAYFMDFKFEPGNYYLAGREQLEGKEVLRIEYYPQHLFSDDDEKRDKDKDEAGAKDTKDTKDQKAQDPKAPEKKSRKDDKETALEQDIERKMNKTALVTLWIDPAEHQIVKYTFDNVWMDFLPGGWLVRVDDIRASMTMGQPFPGVWLPRALSVHAGVSLANGAYEATYARTFSNYKLADVKTRITIPKDDRPDRPSESHVDRAINLDVSAGHGPNVIEDDELPQAEVVNEIRVHGNVAITDDAIVQLAGLSIGQTLGPDALESIERRLKQSGRFESIEVRKRYRSLSDMTDVAIVLVVHEKPGTVVKPGDVNPVTHPFHRVTSRMMFLPILSYEDGYGFTYGGRISTMDLLGTGERLSVPLTWGGTKRAALEYDRTFAHGPITCVATNVAIWNRENPHFDLDEQRVEWTARAERQFGKVFRTDVRTSQATVNFGDLDDRQWTFGADATFDTRHDPTFPRNAILAGTGWTGLHVEGLDRIDRYTTDLRGYLGVIGQAVLAARVQYAAASDTLPSYERLLIGGASTLRGFRAGTFDGDRSFVTSAELRVPITSVLSGARLGVTAFMDAAKAFDKGVKLSDADWHQGVGGGVFLIATVVTINVDIAHSLKNGDTRVHLSSGFSF